MRLSAPSAANPVEVVLRLSRVPRPSDKGVTYSPHCSSLLGLSFRILDIDLVEPQKGTTMETIGRVAVGGFFGCKAGPDVRLHDLTIFSTEMSAFMISICREP